MHKIYKGGFENKKYIFKLIKISRMGAGYFSGKAKLRVLVKDRCSKTYPNPYPVSLLGNAMWHTNCLSTFASN
jgi:hypothetical protein